MTNARKFIKTSMKSVHASKYAPKVDVTSSFLATLPSIMSVKLDINNRINVIKY